MFKRYEADFDQQNVVKCYFKDRRVFVTISITCITLHALAHEKANNMLFAWKVSGNSYCDKNNHLTVTADVARHPPRPKLRSVSLSLYQKFLNMFDVRIENRSLGGWGCVN